MNKMGGSIQLQLPHAQQFDSKLPAERLSEDHRVSPAGCRTLRVVRRVRGNNLGIVMFGLFKPTALALNGDSPRHTNGAKDVAETPARRSIITPDSLQCTLRTAQSAPL